MLINQRKKINFNYKRTPMSLALREVTSMAGLVGFPENTPIAIRLSSQPISTDNMSAIAAYMNGRCIKSINLDNTHLNDERTVILTQAVRASQTVRYIRLSNNNIGNVGAKAIAECISLGRDITWHVNRNKIRAEGAEALARACVLNRNHYSINLIHNQLGDDGAKRVALALRENRGNIADLYLTHNGIGPDGDQALAENLPRTIDVTYRTEEITASEYFRRHRCVYIFTLLIFFPVLLVLPWLPNMEDDISGLINRRTGPNS